MFDWAPIRRAFFAGEYEKCQALLAHAPRPRADIWLSWIDNRRNKTADQIQRLLNIESSDAHLLAERDVWLAAAYNSTGEFDMAHRLIERALRVLQPGSEMYYRAIYTHALTYYLIGDYAADEPLIECLRNSPRPQDRAQAYAMRSWISAKREDLRGQLNDLLSAVREFDAADEREEYLFVHTLLPLASLCREIPTQGAIEPLRAAAATVRRESDITAFARFQLIRILGWIDALAGDEVSAVRSWHDAEATAPSEFWRLFCIVDRAYLSLAMGRRQAGRDALETAHEAASRLAWAQTEEDERIILLTIAQLFAEENAALAQRYLAIYRSIPTGMHALLGWVGDRRTRALQIYPQGVALLHLGEREAAISMLKEAWEIFSDFEYEWRASLAALNLYSATGEKQWLVRAREQAAPWPQSWIARDVRAAR